MPISEDSVSTTHRPHDIQTQSPLVSKSSVGQEQGQAFPWDLNSVNHDSGHGGTGSHMTQALRGSLKKF